MKIISLYKYATLIWLISTFGCTRVKNPAPPINTVAKQDSIRNDEKNFPIEHHYLVLNQRAVIRPIYVETIENVKAVHKGYLIHITLNNKSNSTAYKQIAIEISYFSKKGIAMDKEVVTINQVIKPQATLKTAKKVLRYQNSNYKVKILSAKSIA